MNARWNITLLVAVFPLVCARLVAQDEKPKPAVTLTASALEIIVPSAPECASVCKSSPSGMVVQLSTDVKNAGKTPFIYTYAVTGGRVTGEGARVTWDLSGARPGVYAASVEVRTSGEKLIATSTQVALTECQCDSNKVSPTINVNCPRDPSCNAPVPFLVSLNGATSDAKLSYTWTVAGGTIVSGQGTDTIMVQLDDRAGSVTASVEVGGLHPGADKFATCSMRTFCGSSFRAAQRVGEFGRVNWGSVTASLDAFAVQINDDTADGEILVYYDQKSLPGEALRYAYRMKSYLVYSRRIDPARINVLPGGEKEKLIVELWSVPHNSMRGPEPDPPFDRPKDNSAYLYDRYDYQCYPMFHRIPPGCAGCEDGPRSASDHSVALSFFGSAVATTPRTKAFLIVYPFRKFKRRVIERFIDREKDFLIQSNKIDSADITTRIGPVRQHGSVELWVVPPNAAPPRLGSARRERNLGAPPRR
jgi:hypothetical protein